MTTTTTISSSNLDHMTQICRERSERGVATRADWQCLAECDPIRARSELISYLETSQQNNVNPYDHQRKPRTGLVLGFVAGVVLMSAWWLIGNQWRTAADTTAREWDVITFSMYVAASMLPVFALIGYRWDQRRASSNVTPEQVDKRSRRDATWDDLLAEFDATRKSGGTRMY